MIRDYTLLKFDPMKETLSFLELEQSCSGTCQQMVLPYPNSRSNAKIVEIFRKEFKNNCPYHTIEIRTLLTELTRS